MNDQINWRNNGNVRYYNVDNVSYFVQVIPNSFSSEIAFYSDEPDYINVKDYTLIKKEYLHYFENKRKAISEYHNFAVKYLKRKYKVNNVRRQTND